MAKKRKEARNIMKFGENVDLERKYFDKWKTKGTFVRIAYSVDSTSMPLEHLNANTVNFTANRLFEIALDCLVLYPVTLN